MSLTKEIKELQIKAELSDRWKKRYEDLYNEVNDVMSKMSNLMGNKFTLNRRVKYNTKLNGMLYKIRDKLYDIMIINNQQYSHKDLSKVLLDEGINNNNRNINSLMNLLLNCNGIEKRKDGRITYIFYSLVKNNKDKPSFTSITEKTHHNKVGEIDTVEQVLKEREV